jgi:hypothetical protein
MPIPEGHLAVKNLVEASGAAQTPAELHALLPEVRRRAKQFDDCYSTCRDNKGDRCLYYDGRNHEIELWHIGLMFAEYVARLLLTKAGEGHCYAENRTNTVCSFSRDMHLKMLAALKEDLRNLADEIDALEAGGRPVS